MTAKRREFLKAAAGLMIVKAESVYGTPANSTLEVGIIGCGGRGVYIGNFFVEHTLSKIVALADAFEDRLAVGREKFQVEARRAYRGLEAYRELIGSRVDAVAIESPPYFHPEQARAAVEAGKHVYLAKPVATDAAGCRSILESGRRAQGKFSFLVDFQTRARPVFLEAARRVHEGAIGPPVSGQVFYQAGRLRPQATGDSAEARLRNWVFDKQYSGDIIVEQNIHVVDVANWYLRSHPLKAFGTGGRKARVDVGDCWDHFLVTYWYPNDVKIDFSSGQYLKGFNDLCIRIYGPAGTVDSHYNGAVAIRGDNPWHGSDKDDTFHGGAITNVKNFVASIRDGKYLNNAAESVESNLTCILGRQAAYGERVVRWEEL
jgi:predicted dehydrogenase